VPRQIVPDNLRAGVLRANWYEPGINPTYRDLAAHYGTAILPTRVRRPALPRLRCSLGLTRCLI
ncbi:MAG TPA: hypothetical protein VIY55_06385, partial [Acetobacteraceae bacterium]